MADWHRIEINSHSVHMEPGLQARLADPLWMLFRQWQTGEWQGEDAGSPVQCQMEYEQTRLESWYPGARIPSGESGRSLKQELPLEVLVEQETVLSGPAAIRLSADAGLHFIRYLHHYKLAELITSFQQTYPLDAAQYYDTLPRQEQSRFKWLLKRSFNGKALYDDNQRVFDTVSALKQLSSEHQDTFRQILQNWRSWYETRFIEPEIPQSEAWNTKRMEYEFTVAAPTRDGEVVLDASGCPGGHLDWYSFDVAKKKTHKLSPRRPLTRKVTALPTLVSYHGMPATRWWEFENNQIQFGAIDAGPTDLARMAVAEFASVYSNDWFSVPLRVPMGALGRVKLARVNNTFGDIEVLQSLAVNDHAAFKKKRPWVLFELHNDASAENNKTPYLFIPPVTGQTLESAPREKVTLLRDEMANLAWGIENLYESIAGTRIHRHQQWVTSDKAQEAALQRIAEDQWNYRAEHLVPPYWIPFVPERKEDGVSIDLRRARMQSWEELPGELVGIKGVILVPTQPLRLFEEEVLNGGVEITRTYQAIRWVDGTNLIWSGRKKQPGKGNRESYLRWDQLK